MNFILKIKSNRWKYRAVHKRSCSLYQDKEHVQQQKNFRACSARLCPHQKHLKLAIYSNVFKFYSPLKIEKF